jgi:uncharacterized protein
MLFRSVVLSVITAALTLAAPPTPAHAEANGCNGINLLDEMKVKDAPAYARIRAAADANKNGKSLLWKIESEEFPDRPASYLFGTLGFTDNRLMTLRPAVEEVLNFTSRIALEVDETSPERTQEALAVMRNVLVPPAEAKLETLLAKSDATRTNVMLIKSGLPKEWVPRVKPWVAMLLTATSECERSRLKAGKLTLDGELARQAEARGVGSFGLESTEMKLGALAALDDAAQVSLLKASLAGFDRLDDKTEAMVQLYLARDAGALWPLQEELARQQGADQKALSAFRESYLDDRNARMRDRTMMHLQKGGVFIAVGAMHLPGERGLVELFKEAGFKLSAVE